MEKKEFRVLIKHCFLMGKNTVEAKQWLDKHYGTSAPGKSTIIDWYADFKRGRTDTDDAHRSGRPNEAVVPEKIKQVHKLVLSDRKLKLDDIADIVKISKGSVFTILHDHLSMRKLCSKWVPRLLTVDQKQSMATMVKLNELGFQLLPHPPYSPDLAPSDYFLFAELKKMLAGKKFRSDEEVIAETDAYFEGQPKSFYKTGIERLERRWTDCIALKGNYIDE
ncbi:PREDICTED: putative uncharacterized protein FLJ37770 [Trachymyrmex septentrionalis]|nr:PREDICTED: putative uncharacterized protein FLJ37770 [Trachymyrmex septentrionalis]